MESVRDNTVPLPTVPNQSDTLALNCSEISFVSFNMHGFNQGFQTVRDLIFDRKPDVFMLQEHWLTPCNLIKFENSFPEYMCWLLCYGRGS